MSVYSFCRNFHVYQEVLEPPINCKFGGSTKEMQQWNVTNERKFYTLEFGFINTRISNKSGFILFLLSYMRSVAVLITSSTEPEKRVLLCPGPAGMEIES